MQLQLQLTEEDLKLIAEFARSPWEPRRIPLEKIDTMQPIIERLKSHNLIQNFDQYANCFELTEAGIRFLRSSENITTMLIGLD